ncbi:MAG: hypothetical protein ACRCXN_13035 [Bacteroidales bacterium]
MKSVLDYAKEFGVVTPEVAQKITKYFPNLKSKFVWVHCGGEWLIVGGDVPELTYWDIRDCTQKECAYSLESIQVLIMAICINLPDLCVRVSGIEKGFLAKLIRFGEGGKEEEIQAFEAENYTDIFALVLLFLKTKYFTFENYKCEDI